MRLITVSRKGWMQSFQKNYCFQISVILFHIFFCHWKSLWPFVGNTGWAGSNELVSMNLGTIFQRTKEVWYCEHTWLPAAALGELLRCYTRSSFWGYKNTSGWGLKCTWQVKICFFGEVFVLGSWAEDVLLPFFNLVPSKQQLQLQQT